MVVGDEFKKIEDDLEKLSIQMITILKRYREEGTIGEEEYREHVKCKEDFLSYLNNERQDMVIE